MRRQTKVALATLGVTGALVAAMWAAREPSLPVETEQSAASAVREQEEQPAATPPATIQPPLQGQASEADPPAREFVEREQFHTRARTFFTEAPALSQSEKAARARGLAEDISRYEAAGELSAAEALLLQTALIRETVADPAAQTAQIAELQKQYQEMSERRKAEWQAEPDPAFELYKAREREIVAQVNAMTEIPGGLSRNEYLRRQLQRAREEANAAAN